MLGKIDCMGDIGGMFLKSFSLEFLLDLNRIQIKIEITEVYFCCIFDVLRVKTCGGIFK